MPLQSRKLSCTYYHNVMPVNKNLNIGSLIDKQIFNGLGAFNEFFHLFVKFRLLY